MTHLMRIAAIAAFTLGGIALSTAPATAVDRPGLAASPLGVTVHRARPLVGGDVRPDRDRLDRRRGFDGVGYLSVPQYQGDSLWRSEGFNDWWHSRPDRNEPRWLRANNCERQFWTGSGWRC